jgi:O-antigen ligase
VVNGLFEGVRNNIFDPNKAGGLFVNANVAAAYLGISFIIYFVLYKIYLKKVFLFISILSIIGIICTGSKAGMLLLILVFFMMINIWNYIKGKVLLNFNLWLVTFLLIEIIIILFLGKHNHIVSQYIDTTNIRLTLWKFGLENIINYPFTGFGFGGWEKAITSYAFQNNIPVLPPHNTLIDLWSNMGLLSIIFALLFIFSILKFSLDVIKTRILELVWLGIGLLNVFLWIFIHGMGTNFGIVGEIHMTIFSGIFLGLVLARYEFYKGLIKYGENFNI